MNFKEQLNGDLASMFDTDTFGETAKINGREATVIIDDEELQKQNLAQTENVNKGIILFYIESSFFKDVPMVNKLMKFNGKDYNIENVKNDVGMLTITLGRNRG